MLHGAERHIYNMLQDFETVRSYRFCRNLVDSNGILL